MTTVNKKRRPRKAKPRRPWRDRFLEALAKMGNVSRACKAAHVSRTMAYEARADQAFADAWDSAIESAADVLEAEAWRRAVTGTLRPLTVAGKKTLVREYSDTLIIFLLKGIRPQKYREVVRNENWDLDLSQCSDEQLDAIVAGKSLAHVLALAKVSNGPPPTYALPPAPEP